MTLQEKIEMMNNADKNTLFETLKYIIDHPKKQINQEEKKNG